MKPTVMLPAFALASLATAASANNDELGALEVQQSWARTTPQGAWTAVSDVALKNTGNVPDLTGGSLAAVGRTEVHETSMDDGALKIGPLGMEIKLGNTAASVAITCTWMT